MPAPSSCISDSDTRFFRDNGFVILRGVLSEAELAAVVADADVLTDRGRAGVATDPDFAYSPGRVSGAPVLRRIEYVIDKSDALKTLLGHPFILNTVEKLVGADFIPTWDSMVLKVPNEGALVPWHRDAGAAQVGESPIFNVDFYLDRADEETCVWVVPGSHEWDPQTADSWLAEHRSLDVSAADFRARRAVPALMEPGDVLLHNILVVHGSPENRSSALRRVVYYEFRSARTEEALGPHTPAYIPLKRAVLRACIQRRKQASYAVGETPYRWLTNESDPASASRAVSDPPTFRYPHADYWRA